MPKTIIGVDLGGTRIRAARLDSQLNIISKEETLTLADEGLEPTLNRIKQQIHRVIVPGETIEGIGVSSPGPLNPNTGVIVHGPNLPGWENVPLGDILKEEFGVPVFVGNDANVAALAEVARGAAQGYRHAIYITVSTGIGSGIIIDGRLLLGREGLAAEFGHILMIVEPRVGTLETEAAGPDMATQAIKRIQAGETSAMQEMVNGDLNRISGKTVGEAALNGDALGINIVSRSGTLIGCGIVNLLHLFNPEIIVIGGGVATNLGDLLFNPMRSAIEKHSIAEAYWRDLVITTPDLGEDVSIVGAGALVATQGGVEDIEKALAVLGEHQS